ncbi:MAG TPA: Crp/Fnr family transcriptional regulator [Gammaproteobacteria bacterium]|nr:Crp/Fnr family transcriptional regulator [Gammaproteobacteria bacterium]
MKLFGENKRDIPGLTDNPVFSALREDQLDSVISTAEQKDLAAGNILFEQGEAASRFYMVKKGQIRLFRLSDDGDEKVIDIVHPGQIFAEAVMFMENRRYPVNAMAITESQVIAFDMETFRNVLRESVDTCFRMMAKMSKRLHIQLNEIDSLSLHNATYRLVHYLLKSIPANTSRHTEITLNYPKNILASRLSIKPETFSRIISRLKKENIIEVSGNQIIISDISALREIAGE